MPMNPTPTREEFERLPVIGQACDGSPIRREPLYGASVWDEVFGWPVTPVAYEGLRLRRMKRCGA